MESFFLVLVTAFLVCAGVIWTRGMHVGMTGDGDLHGVQKMHGVSVPRVGGLAVFVGLALYATVQAAGRGPAAHDATLPLLLACALPAFLSGLFEDVTKAVRPLVRLGMTMLSALLAAMLLSTVLGRAGVTSLDYLLQYSFIALPVTLIAVAGVSNSVNIIDGYNGLASGVSMMILLGIATLAQTVGELPIMQAAVLSTAALLGFLAWNFPFGRIFLGDGGAYFTGYLIAELALMLVSRSTAINPLTLLLLTAYPVTETLFSIVRRRFISGTRATEPDARHLHHLVHNWLSAQPWSSDTRLGDIRNPLTSMCMWAFNALAVVPAVYLRGDATNTAAWLCSFVLCYCAAYGALLRLDRRMVEVSGSSSLDY